MRLLVGVGGLALAFVASIALIFLSDAPAFASSSTLPAVDYGVASGADPWGTAFDASGNVWVAVPGCDPSPDCSSTTSPGRLEVFSPSTKTWLATYQLPAGYGQAIFLAIDASGDVWFPMFHTNTLGMFNPSTNAFSEWTLPTAASGPWDVAIDHNGKVWVTEHFANKIAEFDPVTQTFVKEVATPATSSNPYGITVDAANNVWFTENNGAVAMIAEYTSAGQLREYKIRASLPGTNLTPHMIVADNSGNIWWTEGWVGMIGKLNLAQASPGTTNGVTEYQYPLVCTTCGTHTSGIGIDSSGTIWFDDSIQNLFGTFAPSTGTFNVAATPTAGGHPHDGMNVDKAGNVWFDEEFANKLAESGPNVSAPPPPPVATVGASIAQDTFVRPNQANWGTASDGHAWGADAATNTAFSIANNTGMTTNPGGVLTGTLGAVTGDMQVVATGSVNTFSGGDYGVVARYNDPSDWYKAYIDGTNLVIRRDVSGSNLVLAAVPFAATGGTSYTVKFQTFGNQLLARAWPTAGTEPSSWMISLQDNTFTSGSAGVQVYGSSTFAFTSFAANDLTSSSTTSVTVTATSVTASQVTLSWTAPSVTFDHYLVDRDSSALGTTTAQTITDNSPLAGAHTYTVYGVDSSGNATRLGSVSVNVPLTVPTATVGPSIAQDNFARPDQATWGTSSDGHAWGADAATSAAFAISNSAGQVTNPFNLLSGTLGAATTDMQVVATASANSLGGGDFGVVARYNDANDWYKAYLDGSSLVIRRDLNGNNAVLSSVRFSASGGTPYTIKFQAYGNWLLAKAWAASTAEPTSWMISIQDATFARGSAGVQVYGSPTFTYTSFAANALGTSAPPPTVTVTASSVTPTQVVLNWTTPSVTFNHYLVDRDSSALGTTTSQTITDNAPLAGVHSYTVFGVDTSGNATQLGSTSVTVPTSAPPPTVTVTASSVTPTQVVLNWTTPSVTFNHYLVDRDSSALGTTTSQTITDSAPLAGVHSYTVFGVDTSGNATQLGSTSVTVPGVIAQDTFQRANQTFWGTSSGGQAWGADANSNPAFSISGNAGHISNGNTSYSAVLGPIAANAQVLLTGSISAFNSTNFGGVLRFKDTNNWYKAYIDGSSLVIQKKVNGTTTILGHVPFSATAGTAYSIRFQAIGSALSAKVWAAATSEPASWTATASDSTFASGNCGIRAQVQAGAVATFSSFVASSS